ncbi:hypothetical protein ABBQ38_012249 [Trebouxia sp. C0009 RCD-2024]
MGSQPFTPQDQPLLLAAGLTKAPAQAIFAFAPVHVIPWDPSRPWRGPTQQPAQSTVALYSQGPLYGPDHLSLGVWGWGQQPGHQLVVRQASQRLRLVQARKHGILAPGTLTCQPRLLPSLGSDLTPAEGRCLFLYGKKPSRTPDEPEMCRNNGLDCTRRSVHREKSPRWGWQNVLGP